MKLAATVIRSLQAHMQAEMHDVARLVASGTRASCAVRSGVPGSEGDFANGWEPAQII